jgi:signal transduction histidine kinase
VTDHGVGVAPADVGRIFERWERAASTRHFGGLGLGLYLSRFLVEAHGGLISMESTPNVATTFKVDLPLSTGASPAAHA